MSFAQSLTVAVCTSLCTALLSWIGLTWVALMQRKNEGRRFFRERLIEHYSGLVALAIEDLERAGKVRAGMVLGRNDQKYSGEDEARLVELESKRHSIRLDLLRVAMKVKLFEINQDLSDKAERLAKSQPFMAYPFPPRWGEGNFDVRFDTFCKDIASYEQNLLELTAGVRKLHTEKLAS